MSILFTSFRLKDFIVKNRLIRSATTSYWSDEGGILREPIFNHYSKLAEGGIGLIIKGHSYVNETTTFQLARAQTFRDLYLDRSGNDTENYSDLCWTCVAANHDGSLWASVPKRGPQEGDGSDCE